MKIELSFEGEIISWRGPAPFYFIAIPKELSLEIKAVSAQLSYGWGVIPLEVEIQNHKFTTAVIPREGLYMLPIKKQVRLELGLELGQVVPVSLTLG
jgi:hypothetical protein